MTHLKRTTTALLLGIMTAAGTRPAMAAPEATPATQPPSPHATEVAAIGVGFGFGTGFGGWGRPWGWGGGPGLGVGIGSWSGGRSGTFAGVNTYMPLNTPYTRSGRGITDVREFYGINKPGYYTDGTNLYQGQDFYRNGGFTQVPPPAPPPTP